VRPFLAALAETPLLFDGAMGSLLYERGVFLTRCFDELNLSQPEIVAQAHRDYLEAGADIIETNTFGSNRVALARHGFADKVAEINRAGVRLARGAAGEDAYVAGAIGPTGIDYLRAAEAEKTRARDALTEQTRLLAEAGVDVLLYETFPILEELLAGLAIARQVAPSLPVIAQVMFPPEGKLPDGRTPGEVADALVAAGADVIGANCGAGPPELYEVATQMVGHGRPVAIQPNAGLPRMIEGRTIYVANPEHFGVFARRLLQIGVALVGGCCGTTPEHITRMAGAVRMRSGRDLGARVTSAAASSRAPALPEVPLAQRSGLAAKLAAGQFVVSVELSSPPGIDPTKAVAAARKLYASGKIDAVNIADGPRATARMANLALCALVQQGVPGLETILHVCCRDHNLIGLVAHLLGAHTLGLRNLVVITGDPPKIGDYPFATPVYDLDSIGLLRLAAELNRGLDPAGKGLGTAAAREQTGFLLATGAEPGAVDYDRELRRLAEKKAAGAELVMTQPIYDPRVLERFLDDVKPLGLPVLVGLLPLASARNAEFLHNEVPGMRIPDDIRARMAKAKDGPAARAEGLRIAREALAAVRHRVQGAYIMPPFGRYDAALKVLS
jgi:homocysteine S-methyltransferase